MKIEKFNDIMKKSFGDRLINIPTEEEVKMIVQDWVLHKSYNPSIVWVSDGEVNGAYIQDFNYTAKEFRAIGTQEQLDEAINGEWTLKIDEFYTYEPISKEDFWHKEEKREQYNKKVTENLKIYRKLYKKNENKLLILRTN